MKSIFFLAPDWSPVKNAFRPVSRSTEERRTASLILTPSRLTSAAARASKPLRLGARSPRRALLPDLASEKNRLTSTRRSLKLTMQFRAIFSFGGSLSDLDRGQVGNIPAAIANARAFAA